MVGLKARRVITYRIAGLPPGARFGRPVTVADDTSGDFIESEIRRWLSVDPTLPRNVEIVGLRRHPHPIVADIGKIRSIVYLYGP